VAKEGDLPAELATMSRFQPPGDLEKLFLEHQGRIYRAAFRVTGSASDAEDVLQTVFLRLMRREGAPLAMDFVSSYLYRAAVNTALDVLRARRPSVPIEDVEERLAAVPDPSDRRDEIRASLRNALARLQPRWAEIFVLRYFEDYENREIAGMLGMSQATVGVTLFRARHRLRKELEAQTRGGR
jgi:RNA polymerase sigma-70 factor, ECF subfamily